MTTANDFTKGGLKLEGQYENDRNAESRELFKAIIREAYGVQDVIIAHHLTYVKDEGDFEYVEEVPSADALIFDHDVARKIWGVDKYKDILVRLALEPIATRDKLLGELYHARGK
jgi:hypothetical protein